MPTLEALACKAGGDAHKDNTQGGWTCGQSIAGAAHLMAIDLAHDLSHRPQPTIDAEVVKGIFIMSAL